MIGRRCSAMTPVFWQNQQGSFCLFGIFKGTLPCLTRAFKCKSPPFNITAALCTESTKAACFVGVVSYINWWCSHSNTSIKEQKMQMPWEPNFHANRSLKPKFIIMTIAWATVKLTFKFWSFGISICFSTCSMKGIFHMQEGMEFFNPVSLESCLLGYTWR